MLNATFYQREAWLGGSAQAAQLRFQLSESQQTSNHFSGSGRIQ